MLCNSSPHCFSWVLFTRRLDQLSAPVDTRKESGFSRCPFQLTQMLLWIPQPAPNETLAVRIYDMYRHVKKALELWFNTMFQTVLSVTLNHQSILSKYSNIGLVCFKGGKTALPLQRLAWTKDRSRMMAMETLHGIQGKAEEMRWPTQPLLSTKSEWVKR